MYAFLDEPLSYATTLTEYRKRTVSLLYATTLREYRKRTVSSQPAIACSKLTVGTLKQGVNYVQS